MAKLILDVMGGDFAPHAALEGAIEALPELAGNENHLVLVGDEPGIRDLITKRNYSPLGDAIASGRVSIVHAPENIDMDDSIKAVRSKPNASINVGCKLAAESYGTTTQAAFISAGHSGAVMASALLNMGRIKGIERPAIAVKLPSLSPDGTIVLDVGANIDCKPEHLRDFAIMGALFGQAERQGKGLPRVALISNGEERSKGTEETRAAYDLIEKLDCFKEGPEAVGRFTGYCEGKEVFKGSVDVVVTDGFVGNVLLKSAEGLGSAIMTLIKQEAKKSAIAPLGFLLASGVFRRLKRKIDYAETGAAPLLGVAGYAFICHGRSNPRAMKNALLRARTALKSRYVERLESAVKQMNMERERTGAR